MSWDYSYALNGNLTLSDVCTAVRVEAEGGASFRDAGYQIPGRDGVQLDDEAPYGPLSLVLRTILRYTNSSGAVTHSDGEAGHVFENLSKIKAEFAGPGLATLTRTVPDIGDVRALCKLTGNPFQGSQKHIFHWPLTIPSGSWQDASESSDTGDPPTGVTTTGDRVIFDPRLSISAAGETEFTLGDGTVYTITAAAGPTYPVVVDVGAGTAVDNAGADALGSITFTGDKSEHWFRLHPNETASLTTDNAVTVYWRDRWA